MNILDKIDSIIGEGVSKKKGTKRRLIFEDYEDIEPIKGPSMFSCIYNYAGSTFYIWKAGSNKIYGMYFDWENIHEIGLGYIFVDGRHVKCSTDDIINALKKGEQELGPENDPAYITFEGDYINPKPYISYIGTAFAHFFTEVYKKNGDTWKIFM